MVAGQVVTGNGIAAGTTVQSVTNGTTFELSQATNLALSGDTLRSYSPLQNDVPARLRFNFTSSRLRNYLNTGVITLNGTTAIDVNWGTGTTNGNNSGVIAGGLAGAGNLIKWGAGNLFVRGDNSAFTGNTFIEQGALSVLHNNALGSTYGQTVTVRKYGVLDVGVSDFNPTSLVISYETGGIERWSVDGARDGLATLELGGGTLQINANQTNANVAAMVVNLTAGGGIEAFITQSDAATNNNGLTGVFRTVGSNVGFNLTGGVTIGQNLVDGINGLDNGRGPQQTIFTGALNIYSGTTAQYNGAILEINGVIDGTGSLTKQGYDIVTLGGQNLYTGGTTVFQGVLRNGVNNALKTDGNLVTQGEGVYDLFGFNQTVRHLSSPASTLANSMGFITNTGTETATFTVGNSSSSHYTYGGTLQNNLKVVKTGAHVFKVTAPNTYIGGTDVNAGWMETQNTSGSGTGTGTVTVQTAGILAGGNSTGTTGMITGLVNLKAGGTLQPGAVDVSGSPASLGGTLKLGSLKIDGGNLTFQLSTPASTTDDLIALTNPNFTGSSVLNITAAATITIQELTSNSFTSGFYDLITYANGTRSGFDNLSLTSSTLTNTNGTFALILVDDTANNRIQLQAVSNDTLKWYQPVGADAVWDTGAHTPQNWRNLVPAGSDWVEALDAVFDDTAIGYTPNVSGTVTPKSIQFNNATNYTLGGTGNITGTGALTKINSGRVTINNGNLTFSGGSTISAGTIQFGASSTDAGGVVTSGPLGTGTISLNPTASVKLQADATNRSIANSVIIGGSGNVDFDTNGGGQLTFDQGTTGTGSTTTLGVNATFNVASGTTTTFSQPVVGSGSRSLTKTGSGTLIFTAANTYSAGTTVSAGVLQVTSAGSLATGSNLTIGASGTTTLENVGQSLGVAQVDGTLNLNAASGTTTINTLNGAATGDINFGSATTLSVSQSTTDYAGRIDGAGVLTKTSVGDLALTGGSSTFSGGTSLANGSLTLGADSTVSGGDLTQGPVGTGALTVATGTSINSTGAARTIHNAMTLNGTVTFGGNFNHTYTSAGLTTATSITMGSNLSATVNAGLDVEFVKELTGGFTLTKLGAGRLILTNVDNTYTGVTTVNVGTLAVESLEVMTATPTTQKDSLGGSNNTAASLTINGGILQYVGAGSTTDRLFTVGASGATLDAIGTGAIVFNNAAALGGSGNRNLVLTGSNTGNNELAAVIGLAAGTLTKNGAGTWFLSGVASTYTGATTINAGVLKVNLMANGAANSSIGASSNAAANFVIGNGATFSYVGSSTSATNRQITLGNQSAGRAAIFDSSGTGVVQFNNNAAVTHTGAVDNSRTIELTGTSGSVATANQFSISLADRGTGATNVIKTGTGVWSLANANSTFNGSVDVQNGTLIVNNVQNANVASNLGDANGSTAATGLIIGGTATSGTLRFEGSGGINNSTNRLFTVGAAGGAIDASGASGTALSFTNAGSLTMAAATTTPRTLTLTGSNTDDNTLSSIIVNGTGAGLTSLAKTGDGTWRLSGVNTYTGSTTISDGTLKNGVNNAFAATSAVTVAAVNASDSATWLLNGFNNTTNSLTVGGAANSTATVATGAGTLTLGGNVTYDATANAGSATISGLVATTAARTFTVGDSSNTSSELNVTAVISGTGGGVVKDGAGTMVLAGANSYTGTTVVNAGILQVGQGGTNATVDDGRTGTGAVTVNGGMLAGTGTLNAAVVVNSGAVLAPGDLNTAAVSIAGRLDAVDNVSLVGTGELQLQIGGATLNKSAEIQAALNTDRATYDAYVASNIADWNNRALNAQGTHDLLNFTTSGRTLIGTADSTETIRVTSTGYGLKLGDIFDLVDWFGIAGMTNIHTGGSSFIDGSSKVGDLDLSGITLGAGLGWDATQFASYGVLIVVPEPSRMLLLMFGLLGLFFRRRRRVGSV
jgi:fibronectin-binding autotransporter adhesin